jgi:hypothetical protein
LLKCKTKRLQASRRAAGGPLLLLLLLLNLLLILWLLLLLLRLLRGDAAKAFSHTAAAWCSSGSTWRSCAPL